MSTSLTSASKLAPSQLANLHGELSAGRNPRHVLQDETEQKAAPVTADDGTSVLDGSNGGAIQALVNVGVRHVAAYRTVIIQIATVTDSVNYALTFTVNAGTATVTHPSGVGATKQSIAEGLKSVIDSDPTLGTELLAYAEQDPDTGDYRLRVTGDQAPATSSQGNDDYSIDGWQVGASANGAELAVSADPNYVELVYWGLPGGAEESGEETGIHTHIPFEGGAGGTEESSGWRRLTQVTKPGTVPTDDLDGLVYVPFGGRQHRLDVRGLQRLHVQVVTKHGPSGDQTNVTLRDPFITIGPCKRESTRPLGS